MHLPDNLLSHRRTWLAAMERLIELENEADPVTGIDDKDFWSHEYNAMKAMYEDLDQMLQMAYEGDRHV